ncbi:FAD binding domain-containing protein [Gallaecimonas pentaromativorans]|uniref:2-polyprenyl-6-methoxyphenol hydroxylase-like FAD-dependent oxidoreductase n=1 Tax=Gallaecimonas pentaromativorans TaxID=584787 RepID=A0A3N1PPY3_9GAMM|nr:FAD binding domain-containing protein [Gallaecimonas pentaromativorans]ROQ30048.1 2-polyprenyl-6-methoxyphenol hydroxylase-like FAD-dependent oxidoreductase [Gallaecimonas pentaromativorans]
MKAIIIGGSLAGLFTANALTAIGWQVEVFERSESELDSRGGGIVLQPEVVEAFVFSSIRPSGELGVTAPGRQYLDASGLMIGNARQPQMQTSWNLLYGYLKGALDSAHYHQGAELSHFEQDEHGVRAFFSDGREATGDLLIGADGPGSAVRSQLLPGLAPQYAGYLVWRGLVDEHRLPDSVVKALGDDFVFQQNPESLMLQYKVPGSHSELTPGLRRNNWLWYIKAEGEALEAALTDKNGVRRGHSVPPGLLAASEESRFRALADTQLNPAFKELVRLTDDLFVQAILDLKVPRMVFGRALLLGDAAFIPRPHTAGSTAKAAANALALARALQNHSALEPALAQWQQQQLTEGQRMVDWGVRMGNRLMAITHSKGGAK